MIVVRLHSEERSELARDCAMAVAKRMPQRGIFVLFDAVCLARSCDNRLFLRKIMVGPTFDSMASYLFTNRERRVSLAATIACR